MMHSLRALVLLLAVSALVVPACRAGEAQGLPEAVTREVPDPGSLPGGKYTPAITWQAEGKEFSHRAGQAVPDPDAEEGSAWEARAGAADAAPDAGAAEASFILFGPYATLEPGDYVAFARTKLLDDPTDDPIADLDVCVSYGSEVLAMRPIEPGDLRKGAYVQVPIGFRYPGDKIECRLNWHGYASIRVDSVALFRVEGADAQILSGKVPQPMPSGQPRDLAYKGLERPGVIFPHSSKPAATLLVADLRKLRPDWQLCLTTLQGLVNRKQPRIYCILDATDLDWLAHLRKRGWIGGTEMVARPQDLVKRFRDEVKGVVVTDLPLPATKNVATTLAGVRDGIVASPLVAKELGLPVLEDLRGRWQTSDAAYRWLFEKHWGEMSHQVAACLWPDSPHIRDYLVQHRALVFWLPGRIDGARKYSRPDAEVRLVEEMLAKLPANIPILGYPYAGKEIGMGEGPGVTLLAEFGKYLVGSINCANLSVHSGIVAPKPRITTPPPPAIQRDKTYVSIIISDGDNLPVLTTYNFPQLWKDPLRGKLALGWTISPSAGLLIPAIADFYTSTATAQDAFLTAVSGVGYTYPDQYGKRFRPADRARVFDGFLDQTGATMGAMGLKDARIMGVTRPELIRRYAERIPQLRSIFPDYGRRVMSYDEGVYPTVRNVPVFHAANGWKDPATRDEQIALMVEQIRGFTPKRQPAFLHLFVWNWGFDLPMLKEVLDRLGSGYVAVRPDHLAMLYKEEIARQQLLARIPESLASIEGMPITFSGSLHNATGRPIQALVRVTSGLETPLVRPNAPALAPGETKALSISGVPIAREVTLAITGPFGTLRRVIECSRVTAAEIAGDLPKGARLTFSLQLDAVALVHRSGAPTPDPAAGGKSVWSAVPKEAEPGHIIFGPYTPLPAGAYLALFRMKRTGEGTGVAAVIDTCASPPVEVSATREVLAKELPLGQYRSVLLPFRHPGGSLETRVLWPGNAAIAVDSIAVWEVRR